MATEATSHTGLPVSALQAVLPSEPADGVGDVILDGEELFMTLTQEEQDRWRTMIKEREGSLQTRKEQFQRWYDNFNRRRMFAYSRARKLHESLRQRAGFYADLSALMATQHARARKSGHRVRFAAATGDCPEAGQVASQNPLEHQGTEEGQQPEHHQQQQDQQDQQQQGLLPEQGPGQQQHQQAKGSHGQTEDTVTVKPLLTSSQ